MYHLWVFDKRERVLTMLTNFMNNKPGIEANQPAAWKSYTGARSTWSGTVSRAWYSNADAKRVRGWRTTASTTSRI